MECKKCNEVMVRLIDAFAYKYYGKVKYAYVCKKCGRWSWNHDS